MSHEVDETYDVYHEVYPLSRKAHTCDACKQEIPKGTHYTRVHIVFHGGAESVKRCLRCQAIHLHLRTLDPGYMWPDERLACGIDYEEHWGGEPPEEIAALAFFPEVKLEDLARYK